MILNATLAASVVNVQGFRENSREQLMMNARQDSGSPSYRSIVKGGCRVGAGGAVVAETDAGVSKVLRCCSWTVSVASACLFVSAACHASVVDAANCASFWMSTPSMYSFLCRKIVCWVHSWPDCTVRVCIETHKQHNLKVFRTFIQRQ